MYAVVKMGVRVCSTILPCTHTIHRFTRIAASARVGVYTRAQLKKKKKHAVSLCFVRRTGKYLLVEFWNLVRSKLWSFEILYALSRNGHCYRCCSYHSTREKYILLESRPIISNDKCHISLSFVRRTGKFLLVGFWYVKPGNSEYALSRNSHRLLPFCS